MVGRARARPRRDRCVRLLQAPGDRGRAERERRRRAGRRPRQGLPLQLELHLRERRHRRRPAPRAGRPERQARGDRADVRRHPLVVDPGARRQDRRHPGDHERDVVQRRGGGRLPRSVRGALRRPARGDERVRRGDAARGVRGVAGGGGRRAGGRHVGSRRGDVRRRLREVPRPRGRGRHRPGAQGQRPARGRGGGRGGRPARTRRDAPGRRRLAGRPDGRADRVPAGGGARWQSGPRRPIPQWQRGRVVELAPDRRPQADRDPLHRHVGRCSSSPAA